MAYHLRVPVCLGLSIPILRLTFTTLSNSADDKLMIFFLFFPENRFKHCMHCQLEKIRKIFQIVVIFTKHVRC